MRDYDTPPDQRWGVLIFTLSGIAGHIVFPGMTWMIEHVTRNQPIMGRDNWDAFVVVHDSEEGALEFDTCVPALGKPHPPGNPAEALRRAVKALDVQLNAPEYIRRYFPPALVARLTAERTYLTNLLGHIGGVTYIEQEQVTTLLRPAV
jgi:hypothetical protein